MTNGNVVDLPTPVAPVTKITRWFNIWWNIWICAIQLLPKVVYQPVFFIIWYIDNKLSDSELVVLSWNILNSDIEINKFTFSFYSNKFAEEISKVDNSRFFNFRKDIIIDIIYNLLQYYDNKIIICLQEVNKIILSEFIRKFGDRVIFTEDKIDQRVIIFGDKIKFSIPLVD